MAKKGDLNETGGDRPSGLSIPETADLLGFYYRMV